MHPDVFYVWVGGSCDYGHEERASAGKQLIQETLDNVDMQRRSLSFENGALYALESDDNNELVVLNPVWKEYLETNCTILM